MINRLEVLLVNSHLVVQECQVGNFLFLLLKKVLKNPFLAVCFPLTQFFFLFPGTNDKAGGPHYVLRWGNPQAIKESFVPVTDIYYPYMSK